jgi:hypothetical protein
MRSRMLGQLFVIGLLCVPTATAWADAPWARMAIFRRVEADPSQDYLLTENEGPWMIMAATFSGEGARDQARELVLELRKEYKLPAYLYRVQFDYNQEPVRGLGVDRYGKPQRVKYQRERIEEFAVLVGNYESNNSPDAERDLAKVKFIEPLALSVAERAKQGKPTYQQLVGFRLAQKNAFNQRQKLLEETKGRFWGKPVQLRMKDPNYWGPMGSAFLTRNPRLPKESEAAVVDRFVYDMNKDVKYSLLDCPGQFTLQVATFKGAVVVDQKTVRDLERGEKKIRSRLADAAQMAHELTEALRTKGYEAYEFHARGASIVTVGHFEFVGTPRADGKIEINPEIHRLMQLFAPDASTGGRPKTLVGIPFDVQPLPVRVPRRSISADYAQQ